MAKTDSVKATIIAATIELIKAGDGNIDDISTRSIAERAGVGVGLINYHFQTRQRLMELCVQRIIATTISSYRPHVPDTVRTPLDRLIFHARLIADFLVDNPAVARMSILCDLTAPSTHSNSMTSAMGAGQVLSELNVPERERPLLAFALISSMQTPFLYKDHSCELVGYDITEKLQRDEALGVLVGTLFSRFAAETGAAGGTQSAEATGA